MNDQTQPPLPQSAQEADSDSSPGWIASFGIVMALLFALRWGVRNLESPDHQVLLMTGGVASLLFIQFLRRALLRALIVSAVFVTALFGFKHFDEIRDGRVSPRVAAASVFKSLTGFGPIREFSRLRDDTKYGIYLQAVRSRDEEVNLRATEISRGCGGRDEACVATKIVNYVTSNFEYRSDPIQAPGERDYVKSPQQTIRSGAGDCDDLTVLTTSMMKIDGKYCYAAEPTASNSSLGVKKSRSDIIVIFDPFNKKRISL
ncbi:MAG: hypothetical protein K0Q68_1991 [Moraxellaceae bacterium]|nr:hypothetical protein [Moraxellaceae bacterium]